MYVSDVLVVEAALRTPKLLTHLKKVCTLCSIQVAHSGIDLITYFSSLKKAPQVIFIADQLTNLEGFCLISYFHFHFPGSKIVCISELNDDEYIQRSFRSGASAFLLRPLLTEEDIFFTLDSLDKNQRYTNVFAADPSLNCPAVEYIPCNSNLTRQEKIYIILNVTSLTYKEIGAIIHIEEKTVEMIGYRLAKKNGIKGGRKNLMLLSIQKGWLRMMQ
jgi:DNA-binding NarL/FixJ family response regulator